MKIIPLACESLGTRSMACYVESTSCSLLIDPSVALAPWRFYYKPHPIEIKRKKLHWQRIIYYAKKADILIITHYHYDHHSRQHPQIFKDKLLLIKDYENAINRSQSWRAHLFLQNIKGLPAEIKIADGGSFEFGELQINFSKPLPHGNSTKLGWVIQLSIREGDFCFLHTSDVQGAPLQEQRDFIINSNPYILYIDGPPIYMFPDLTLEGITEIIEKANPQKLIIDHHYLRDATWRKHLQPIYEVAERKNIQIQCAAEFLGKPIELLEAIRKELYKNVC